MPWAHPASFLLAQKVSPFILCLFSRYRLLAKCLIGVKDKKPLAVDAWLPRLPFPGSYQVWWRSEGSENIELIEIIEANFCWELSQKREEKFATIREICKCLLISPSYFLICCAPLWTLLGSSELSFSARFPHLSVEHRKKKNKGKMNGTLGTEGNA